MKQRSKNRVGQKPVFKATTTIVIAMILGGCGDILYEPKLPESSIVKIQKILPGAGLDLTGKDVQCNIAVALVKDHSKGQARWFAKAAFNAEPQDSHFILTRKHDASKFKPIDVNNFYIGVAKNVSGISPKSESDNEFEMLLDGIREQQSTAAATAEEGGETDGKEEKKLATDSNGRQLSPMQQLRSGKKSFLGGTFFSLSLGRGNRYVTGGGDGSEIPDTAWKNVSGKMVQKVDEVEGKKVLKLVEAEEFDWPDDGIANLGDVSIIAEGGAEELAAYQTEEMEISMPYDMRGDLKPSKSAGKLALTISDKETKLSWLADQPDLRAKPDSQTNIVLINTHNAEGKVDGTWHLEAPANTSEVAVTAKDFERVPLTGKDDPVALVKQDAQKDTSKEGMISFIRRYLYKQGPCGVMTEVRDVQAVKLTRPKKEEKPAT